VPARLQRVSDVRHVRAVVDHALQGDPEGRRRLSARLQRVADERVLRGDEVLKTSLRLMPGYPPDSADSGPGS
jgi:hypothetical protein